MTMTACLQAIIVIGTDSVPKTVAEVAVFNDCLSANKISPGIASSSGCFIWAVPAVLPVTLQVWHTMQAPSKQVIKTDDHRS